MLENEPFEKLPVPYIPLSKVKHYPPLLRFGVAVPDPHTVFQQAALKHNLGDPDQLGTTKSFFLLRKLVTAYINERCGLPPEEAVTWKLIHSKEADLVFEIATNYRAQVPKGKLDDVLRGIREVLSLPDDAHPKWYLEPTIVGKAPDEYRLSCES